MGQSLSVSDPPTLERIEPKLLADCVRELDAGSRALLDLSLRREIRDDAMAPLLHTDAFHLAWQRARTLERVATAVGGQAPAPLADVRAALMRLPADVWAVRPQLMPPGRGSAEAPTTPSTSLVVQRSSRSLVPVGAAPPGRPSRSARNGSRFAVIAGRLTRAGSQQPAATVRGSFVAAAGARVRRIFRRAR